MIPLGRYLHHKSAWIRGQKYISIIGNNIMFNNSESKDLVLSQLIA